MAEYTAIQEQTVQPNQPVIFTESPVPCRRGFVMHEDGTGSFTLSSETLRNIHYCCYEVPSADYLISFSANIAIPEGGTAGAISLALQLGSSTVPATQMIVTPTAVEAFFNVASNKNVSLFKCCRDLAVINTSDQAVLVSNAIINITRPDLVMSY